MDTSKTYIKMCDCEEIQKAEPLDEHGDSLPHQFFAGEWGIYKEDDGYYYLGGEKQCIWLPRQDQLQEMIGDYEECIDLIGWYNELAHPDIGRFNPTSMEQLWLAFVMKEKYNKVWDGENWVEEK